MLPNKTGDIGYHFYNLIDNSKLHFVNGRKTSKQLQYNTNGAFDGSGLFLVSDFSKGTTVFAGENGLVYTLDLNPEFSLEEKSLTISPTNLYLRSKASKSENKGTSMESSVAMFDKYLYVADNYGILRCIDTDTMKSVWAIDVGDNTDATVALDFDENNTLWLYTGTTVAGRSDIDEGAVIRRVNAMTGEIDWSYNIVCGRDSKYELSGVKASPIIGAKQIDSLVIFTVNDVTEDKSTIIAFDKASGNVVWKYELKEQAVSSPVAVYNEMGTAWIIQADLSGTLHMLEGSTGAYLSSLDLEGSIYGSPAVYADILVIGTSQYVYGIKIK